MTLEEFYPLVGGSLDVALTRLFKEELLKKYLKMFLADESYVQLGKAIENKDWRQVFAHSHSLKGVAANLELVNLFNASSELCEDVRNGDPTGDPVAMYEKITEEYNKAVAAIEQVV